HTRSKRDWSSDVCSSDLLVDLRLPLAEARACERAEGTASVAVRTDVGTVLLELDRLVVLVAQDVERARHDTGRASGAQPREHHRSEERRVGKSVKNSGQR